MAFRMSFACRAKSRIALATLPYTQGLSCASLHAPGFKSVIFTPNVPLQRFVSKLDCLAFPGLRNQRIALYSGFINPGKAAKFSTSSAASSTVFQPISGNPSLSNRRTLLSRPGVWALLGAFGLSAVTASLHSSSLLAMTSGASTVDLDSPDSDWKEAKKVLLSATQQQRQAMCRVSGVLHPKSIPIWTPSGQVTEKPLYQVNEALNSKVSLFRGDITRLEVDAIVNAVDGSIHRGAGPLLKKECATLGGCETGLAKITGAYGLPAKHVIHTVGPIAQGTVSQRERDALRSCYRNCLEVGTQNQLRTVAFPCISTGVYGYPPGEAVDVALGVVREYLQEKHAQLDRVIFCVFLKSDEELYRARLPLYFPRGPQMKSKL
ncbi:ADP-ribose glycohydrolase MACROD1 isoform X3 [Brienomyrus brachyistius]|uniref:ADP-ribose glycohydrolase MACROD1 isoform X3 n=1 Tax=Brienomyrus brachyistius TaxID=42636 RepID=UPI0020B437C1|nr:ADP-ribose glycohydrolase MACROD1 isoform X3 [Brienomyrus brachyistius]